jgi:3',5'-cyclic AMP phosphodiesterase CpdA
MTSVRRALVVALLAPVLAGCGASGAGPGDGGGPTTVATWVDSHGSGTLIRGPGEPFLDRTDLAPRSRPAKQLALFAQLTDAHVRDEESPARVPFLDRYGSPFNSTFRPQEALSPQVLAATVRSIDALRPQAVIENGDLIDNDQQNELTQALAVLHGGIVDPNSGSAGYSGVQASSDPDPLFYRPGVDAPTEPSLLATAELRFRSPGLNAPWYPVLGNHDVLAQGEVAATRAINAVATGSRRVVQLPRGFRLPRDAAASARQEVAALLANGLPGRTVRTPPDPTRRMMPAQEVVSRLRAASHVGGSGSRLRYSFDIGPSLRAIVLDTIDRRQGSGGVLGSDEAAWLARQLRAAGDRYVLVFSHQPLTSYPAGGLALSLLDRDSHVIATVAGDTHRNRILARHTPAGGYWMITTSSLADYPQQARAFRLERTANGHVVLETWMIDHDDGNMAGVARELSYLDVQGGRPLGFAGSRLDRNVLLYR